ncbi:MULTISPECIES: CopD family protein [unclassified Janthinobacterium]|uniref:CopD family protein n=1 Tax=unclassified Janthinobacterium TaxID=2610881 RepID=UPI00160EF3D3|nr:MULTISPECIES: CopD family protein [unclassified Janthinobacterium]MBB5371352.1 putative membrane protein [Janthinobacterium sp. K2C7]MBB5384158.1 putative membrane protein [Janthinobacterium sp. K2Li3]MBB5389382.1 putative membrane protein [Janthinobacterium sp. K2E3]
MDYLLLRTLHIAAVATWIGGMLAVAGILACRSQPMAPLLATLRAWDRRVTTPAMLLAWILGLVLASTGGWFPQAWLIAKLFLVLCLSGLHGMLVARLRNRSPNLARQAWPGRFGFFAGILVATAIITVLVIVKPQV